jgi:hypothetical protein
LGIRSCRQAGDLNNALSQTASQDVVARFALSSKLAIAWRWLNRTTQ